jgi:hypothetical protein
MVLPKQHFPSAKASGEKSFFFFFKYYRAVTRKSLLGTESGLQIHQMSHISGNPNILELHVRGAGRT